MPVVRQNPLSGASHHCLSFQVYLHYISVLTFVDTHVLSNLPESGKGSSERESRFFRQEYPSTVNVSRISHRARRASEGTSS